MCPSINNQSISLAETLDKSRSLGYRFSEIYEGPKK
ncbi:hypothetical protein [Methylomonas albis]|nr:hypothetical protein [Methylomonas albis]